MDTIFETNFVVMPTDCNYLSPLIFGGAFFSKMDLCAACTVNRALHASKTCEFAVTHKAETTYSKPCFLGDIIFLKGEIMKPLGKKSIVVQVTAEREKRGSPARDKVASGTFIFVTVAHADDIVNRPDLLPYAHHGLE